MGNRRNGWDSWTGFPEVQIVGELIVRVAMPRIALVAAMRILRGFEGLLWEDWNWSDSAGPACGGVPRTGNGGLAPVALEHCHPDLHS